MCLSLQNLNPNFLSLYVNQEGKIQGISKKLFEEYFKEFIKIEDIEKYGYI